MYDCKAGAQEKAVPLANNKHKQSIHIKNSLSLGGEMSQRDREGRLACNHRVTTNQKPSPLGEGGPRQRWKGGTRWQHRLLHSQRTHPNDCRSKKQHQIRVAIQYCKQSPPLRALTGPPLPKGRGFNLRRWRVHYCANFISEYHRQSKSVSDCEAGAPKKPSPLGEGGPRQRWKGRTR